MEELLPLEKIPFTLRIFYMYNLIYLEMMHLHRGGGGGGANSSVSNHSYKRDQEREHTNIGCLLDIFWV